MLQIRRNVFETNSSSTHSICITKASLGNIKLPEKITFCHGEFGWEEAILDQTEEKASYLYQAICSTKSIKEKERYINHLYCELNKYGIDSEFEPAITDKYGFERGYIDHAGYLCDWLDSVLSNTKRLLRFLCSSESFVLTGNDNSSSDVTIGVNYKHEEYYKGN